ncbi:hypothetical protein FMN63_11570 [Stappia sp. BW2]|uniref:hypothetical protein n=1 Tax=Stappia sp. BW2 TaxID=2592622 RepID=UPI0011DEA1F7|nr:hypothetical protein [Stappia sp. BW2]TYC66760.1 hypothetical protein FMN63_11570 [Stappia sp. BW2]
MRISPGSLPIHVIWGELENAASSKATKKKPAREGCGRGVQLDGFQRAGWRESGGQEPVVIVAGVLTRRDHLALDFAPCGFDVIEHLGAGGVRRLFFAQERGHSGVNIPQT